MIKNLIERIVNRIIRENEGYEIEVPQNSVIDKVTPRSIAATIVQVFTDRMEECSLDNRILFPMSAVVLLKENDYKQYKGYLFEIGRHSVQKFHELIKQKMEEYKCRCSNLAVEWVIEFVPCTDEKLFDNGKNITVKFEVWNKVDPSDETELKNVSFNIDEAVHEAFDDVNINRKLLSGINIQSESKYCYPWDKSLDNERDIPMRVIPCEPDTPKPLDTSAAKQPVTECQSLSTGVGSLTYRLGVNPNVHIIKKTNIILTGPADTQPGGKYRIDCPGIGNDHVTIRYNMKESTFSLSCTAPTKLNGHQLVENEQYALSDGDEICLNGRVKIEFRKIA
jgi:hypothetical protein